MADLQWEFQKCRFKPALAVSMEPEGQQRKDDEEGR